eukprot:TRINITY_DN17748_c0_g1_i1.p1 TRINITY_DN17748_c0_g1~~TRINITY_DN17748_c0_g1_i1.p1  ORF type:complete len:519 (-),score=65.04 TRINITY_DN17748_c0_g1_i1:34-1530(-)
MCIRDSIESLRRSRFRSKITSEDWPSSGGHEILTSSFPVPERLAEVWEEKATGANDIQLHSVANRRQKVLAHLQQENQTLKRLAESLLGDKKKYHGNAILAEQQHNESTVHHQELESHFRKRIAERLDLLQEAERYVQNFEKSTRGNRKVDETNHIVRTRIICQPTEDALKYVVERETLLKKICSHLNTYGDNSRENASLQQRNKSDVKDLLRIARGISNPVNAEGNLKLAVILDARKIKPSVQQHGMATKDLEQMSPNDLREYATTMEPPQLETQIRSLQRQRRRLERDLQRTSIVTNVQSDHLSQLLSETMEAKATRDTLHRSLILNCSKVKELKNSISYYHSELIKTLRAIKKDNDDKNASKTDRIIVQEKSENLLRLYSFDGAQTKNWRMGESWKKPNLQGFVFSKDKVELGYEMSDPTEELTVPPPTISSESRSIVRLRRSLSEVGGYVSIRRLVYQPLPRRRDEPALIEDKPQTKPVSVSYTHLTLPTIYSV